jgi:hypothetical protein
VKNLSLSRLRKIILEEVQKILQDDALFSRDELTDIGTGTIVGLTSFEDEVDADWENPGYGGFKGDIEDAGSYSSCDVCGGSHDIELPCS